MNEIERLLSELDERALAKAVGSRHDEARLRYPLTQNTTDSFAAFEKAIGDYYQYHFQACVSPGGSLPEFEARERAKEILTSDYRRRGEDINAAFADVRDGLNGGLRRVLDIVADHLKQEMEERYTRHVFDKYIAPNSFEDKVEIIRQFFERCGVNLSADVETQRPERYAADYQAIIRAYLNAIRQTGRRLRPL